MRGFIKSNKDDTEGHGISEDSTTTTDDEEGGGGGRQFTLEILHDTRTAAQSLLDMLDIYYGGRDQATNMLVHSWQAQWMLDDVASWTHDDLVVEGGRSLLDVDHDNNKEDCPICFLPMPLILICCTSLPPATISFADANEANEELADTVACTLSISLEIICCLL